MENDGREKAYKFVAYSAVTFSVVAIVSVCVTLPMVYNYVSTSKIWSVKKPCIARPRLKKS